VKHDGAQIPPLDLAFLTDDDPSHHSVQSIDIRDATYGVRGRHGGADIMQHTHDDAGSKATSNATAASKPSRSDAKGATEF
jgi:hypothetical protein